MIKIFYIKEEEDLEVLEVDREAVREALEVVSQEAVQKVLVQGVKANPSSEVCLEENHHPRKTHLAVVLVQGKEAIFQFLEEKVTFLFLVVKTTLQISDQITFQFQVEEITSQTLIE